MIFCAVRHRMSTAPPTCQSPEVSTLKFNESVHVPMDESPAAARELSNFRVSPFRQMRPLS